METDSDVRHTKFSCIGNAENTLWEISSQLKRLAS